MHNRYVRLDNYRKHGVSIPRQFWFWMTSTLNRSWVANHRNALEKVADFFKPGLDFAPLRVGPIAEHSTLRFILGTDSGCQIRW